MRVTYTQAIYPTIIILIVALNKSTLENAVSHAELTPLAFTRNISLVGGEPGDGDVDGGAMTNGNILGCTYTYSREPSLSSPPPPSEHHETRKV